MLFAHTMALLGGSNSQFTYEKQGEHVMKKFFFVSLLVGSLALCSVSFAATPPANAVAEEGAAKVAEQMKELTYKGVVAEHAEGTALVTDNKTYPLVGGDFAMVIGKKVNVFGNIVKEGDVEKLVVTKLLVEKQ